MLSKDKFRGIGYAIAVNSVKLSPKQLDEVMNQESTEELLKLAKGMTSLMFEKDEFLSILKADKEFSDEIMHETEDWIKVLLDKFPERKTYWVIQLQAAMIVGVMKSNGTGNVTDLAQRILGPIGYVLKNYGYEELQAILAAQNPFVIQQAVEELLFGNLLKDILTDSPEESDGDEIIAKVNKILNPDN